MSNPLAIAAVTATLRNLLMTGISADPDLADVTVTMQPVDRARQGGVVTNQLNVFLYHILPSAAWRNMDMPGRVRNGETGVPPLALNLYYLLTAYGRNDDQVVPFSHHLLGRAMSVLGDHPLLFASDIKAALPNNDLWNQVERIRFTLQPLPQDELSKLWTGFQTGFRLSMAYEAAVVLIDSNVSAKTPLPVLSRGTGDTGAIVQASMAAPYPNLTGLILPNMQTSVVPGDSVTLQGSLLGGDQIAVNFDNPNLAQPIVLQVPAPASDTEVPIKIPDVPATWVAGYYTVTVTVSRAGQPDRTTNALSLALAPVITSKLPLAVKQAKGIATIALTSKPQLRPGQRVALLLGDQEIVAPDRAAQSNQTSFSAPVPAGTVLPASRRIRLRVDGVDSPIIDWTKTPPAFDATQMVTIS
ncbi:MAG TPA: DUF4255 domain-containing protein [Steroidobacteraceae bacterium]|nr:DUF4255 domain-containing protein [Steroidobacteraceae bacterium]